MPAKRPAILSYLSGNCAVRRGKVRRTVVPRSGALSMATSPPVAHAPHRFQQNRRLGVSFNFTAEIAHVRINGAIECVGIAPSDAFQQLVAAEYPARVARQHRQQIEFAARQIDPAAPQQNGPVLRIDGERTGGKGGRRRRGWPAIASEHGFDSRLELPQAERLRQIIVGAEFQSEDAIGLLTARGDHDDRDVELLMQPPAERQAILSRQHDVQNDQHDIAFGQATPSQLAVADP
jgi:hypothetical protein